MNTLSVQNLPGGASMALSAPLTISIDHADMKTKFYHDVRGLGIPPVELRPNLNPDWRETGNIAPWWKQIPLKAGQVTTVRRSLEPGPLYKATDADRAALPMTPDNDARDLPSSFTQKPLLQLPRRGYPGSFPHTWIPYSKVRAYTGPDRPPRPKGWAPIPPYAGEEERAISAAMPLPWADEQNMAHDISGVGSLQDFMGSGMGETAEEAKVRLRDEHMKACMEKGMPASTCAGEWTRGNPDTPEERAWYDSVLDFAGNAFVLYQQQEIIKDAKKAEERRKQLEAARLANERAALAAAASQQMPPGVASQFQPTTAAGWGTYAAMGAAGLAVVFGGAYLLKGRKGKGKRR